MKRILVASAILLACASCGKIGSSHPEAEVKLFLTGECLNSPELSYVEMDTEGQNVVSDRFRFIFTFDDSNHTYERTNSETEFVGRFRDIPSDELFSKQFGEKADEMKATFERIFNEYDDLYISKFHSRDFSVRTILYNGGISLTANKEFAGFTAGENLAPIVTCVPMYDNLVQESGENPIVTDARNTPSTAGEFLGIPLDYTSFMGARVEFSIPVEDYSLVNEQVTFELNIPVKVVMYLSWLNDKISDPDAPVPYSDEVLHCRFTTKYGLK